MDPTAKRRRLERRAARYRENTAAARILDEHMGVEPIPRRNSFPREQRSDANVDVLRNEQVDEEAEWIVTDELNDLDERCEFETVTAERKRTVYERSVKKWGWRPL